MNHRPRSLAVRQSTGLIPVILVLAMLMGAALARHTAEAAGPRALAAGQLPEDSRLGPLKDLDGYFPMLVPQSPAAWEARAASLRRQVLVSQGLWPMPTRQPLEPVIHGRIEQEDYTIEKVYFASMPGFFVTGISIVPKANRGGSRACCAPMAIGPKVASMTAGPRKCASRSSKGRNATRTVVAARCRPAGVQLARMGCVVFHYDMIGYADSQQISQQIIHGFQKQRPEMNDPKHWGLYSPQAESRLQSSMGLHTFNSIRALDFLVGLADVDPQRIAVTGASGGGTQTFMLAAIDPRVQAAFPAVMVSTAMQGGCTCENACGLRVGTGNIELAALFAPRPVGLTSANDWTLEMPTKGFPELQQLYRLLGAADQVMLTALPQFGHNYNYVSRAAMYAWFNRHLHLGLPESIVEREYKRLSAEELAVWNDEHPRPESGPDLERRLLAWWHEDAQRQLDARLPTDVSSCRQYQELVSQAVDALVGRQVPDSADLKLQVVSRQQCAGHEELVGVLTYHLPPRLAVGASQDGSRDGVQEQLPVILLRPAAGTTQACIWAFPQGKAGLFDEEGAVLEPIRRLLQAGVSVCAADLIYQGEFLIDGREPEKTRRVENPREAAAYTFGYNPTLFAQRVHDILSLISLFGQDDLRAARVDVVGLGDAGPWAAVAAAQAKQRITRLAVDHADFRFADVADLHSPMFFPGGAKYHDLPGILAVCAGRPLWLATDSPPPRPLQAAYEALGQVTAVARFEGPDSEKLASVVSWLLSGSAAGTSSSKP